MINPTINTCAAEADVVDWCFSFFHPDPSFTVYLYPGLGVVLTLLFITAGIILLAKKCNSKMKKKVPSMFPHFFVSCFSTCSGYLYAFFSKTLIQTECNIMQMLKYFLFFFFYYNWPPLVYLHQCCNPVYARRIKMIICIYETAFVNMGLASGIIRIQQILAVQNH